MPLYEIWKDGRLLGEVWLDGWPSMAVDNRSYRQHGPGRGRLVQGGDESQSDRYSGANHGGQDGNNQ